MKPWIRIMLAMIFLMPFFTRNAASNNSGFYMHTTWTASSIFVIWQDYKKPKINKARYREIDQLIENLDTEFPKDLIRAIAWCESQWRQFDENGNTFTDGSLNTADRKGPSLDYGLMQINEHTARKFKFDIPRLKIDTKYNLECGVKILQEKYRWVIRKQKSEDWTWMLEAYDLAGHSKLEIAIKAYNGMRRTWVYLNVIQDIQRDKPWIEYIK